MESAPISALNRQLAIIFNKQPFVWGGRWWHAAGPDFQHYPLYPLLLQQFKLPPIHPPQVPTFVTYMIY
jgi:hypothetical protein